MHNIVVYKTNHPSNNLSSNNIYNNLLKKSKHRSIKLQYCELGKLIHPINMWKVLKQCELVRKSDQNTLPYTFQK